MQAARNWRMTLSLQKTIEEQIVKDRVIGICITTIVAGPVVGVIASKVLQKCFNIGQNNYSLIVSLMVNSLVFWSTTFP